MEYINKEELKNKIRRVFQNVENPSIECVNNLIEKQPMAFDMNMVIEQLNDYGKYKGILRLEDDKYENFIPLSIAIKIVKSRGLGGVLGYMNNDV